MGATSDAVAGRRQSSRSSELRQVVEVRVHLFGYRLREPSKPPGEHRPLDPPHHRHQYNVCAILRVRYARLPGGQQLVEVRARPLGAPVVGEEPHAVPGND
ncbi:MAG: hypothetical protein M0005_06030 [Actinomycetota bacterium]|nr:hypothetical protein [Actinomycetota bacterium]